MRARPSSSAGQASIVLIGALLVATAVYAGLAFALHMEEMAPLRRMLRKRKEEG